VKQLSEAERLFNSAIFDVMFGDHDKAEGKFWRLEQMARQAEGNGYK